MAMHLAPIAIFAFRRPDHLRVTLENVMACTEFSDSPVYIFCDGPRCGDELEAVAATRATAKELLGDRATLRFAESNQGIARSIVGAVDELTAKYGRVIVVEDDIRVHPGFLSYMNRALDTYAEAEQVFQVSGYMFGRPDLDPQRALFLPLTVSWGWATWARAWRAFSSDVSGWRDILRRPGELHRFNVNGAYDYAELMHRQAAATDDNWDICWYWSIFRRDGVVLFPPRSLVENIGQDGSGVHGGGWFRDFRGNFDATLAPPLILPDDTAVNDPDYAKVRNAIYRQNGGFIGHMRDVARHLLRRYF